MTLCTSVIIVVLTLTDKFNATLFSRTYTLLSCLYFLFFAKFELYIASLLAHSVACGSLWIILLWNIFVLY